MIIEADEIKTEICRNTFLHVRGDGGSNFPHRIVIEKWTE